MPRLSIEHLRASGRPRIYAHRGASARAIENTLQAFALALDEGADGIELDVRRCESGEVVVFHDPDLQRMLGVADRVAALSYAALRRHDLGGGQWVPLLDEVLDLIHGRETWLNIEVKAGGKTPRDVLVGAIDRTLRRRSKEEQQRIFLSTFNVRLLAALQVALPHIPAALLIGDPPAEWDQVESRIAQLDPEGVHPHHVQGSIEHVRAWQQAGRFVNVWTVETAEEARRAMRAGVDGLITDHVREARAWIGA